MRRMRLWTDTEELHIGFKFLGFGARIQPVILEAVGVASVAAVRMPGDGAGHALSHDLIQLQTEMPIHACHRPQRIGDKVEVMDMEDWLCEAALLAGAHHSLCPVQPA